MIKFFISASMMMALSVVANAQTQSPTDTLPRNTLINSQVGVDTVAIGGDTYGEPVSDERAQERFVTYQVLQGQFKKASDLGRGIDELYIENIGQLAAQQHNVRAEAIQSAKEDLLLHASGEDMTHIEVYMFHVAKAALKEGDQAHTLFTKENIIETFNRHAKTDIGFDALIEIVKSYESVASHKKLAGQELFATAVKNWVEDVTKRKNAHFSKEQIERAKNDILAKNNLFAESMHSLAQAVLQPGAVSAQSGVIQH